MDLVEEERRYCMNRFLFLILYSLILDNAQLKKEKEQLEAYVRYLEGFNKGLKKRTTY